MIAALRRIHRQQLRRLRELSLELEVLSDERSRDALTLFSTAFMGVERAGAFLAEVEAARASYREVDYGRWLWEGDPLPELKPRFGWLSNWLPGTMCLRFDRRVVFPALRLATQGMLDEWAFSWPGAYVSMENRRAMVVSLDREVTCYDLLAPGKTPYR